ncbi:hypothetical protein GCM10022223_04710 [Kineosporia mesophila]|uniref:Uncharacterized protein n=1 Tax=Kineosporia mesophila TaxID=566012 RepID=A0ABP6YXT8_9ACTN|nr:hypothetical protein [Kineosporia mesophila]MCD5354317.1 hypothetical protein [Kineosporia mesophila]
MKRRRVRVDNNARTAFTQGLPVDDLTVANAGSPALETHGIDGVTAGTVAARDVGESGVLPGEQ